MSDHHSTTSAKASSGLVMYIVGFVLTILLAYASLYIVSHHVLQSFGLVVALTVLLFVQIMVWLICFFRLGQCAENGTWDLISFLFTLVIVLVVVLGNLWIMYNLNYNMMH